MREINEGIIKYAIAILTKPLDFIPKEQAL